jgi:hypothetical protein
LPDGLWAYAFISGILIIWEREINKPWIALLFFFAICFEIMQYRHVIPGTGDLNDVLTYYTSFVIAIRSNAYFKTLPVNHTRTT